MSRVIENLLHDGNTPEAGTKAVVYITSLTDQPNVETKHELEP